MAALFLLMCMTTVNTIIRKAGIGGIIDAFDMTGFLMVLIIFCALAFQETDKEHIRIDMFVAMLPRKAGIIVDTVLNIITIGTLAYFSYAYFEDIPANRLSGASSQVLKIPEWPFYAVVSLALALFALTVLLNSIEVFIPKEAGQKTDEGPA